MLHTKKKTLAHLKNGDGDIIILLQHQLSNRDVLGHWGQGEGGREQEALPSYVSGLCG